MTSSYQADLDHVGGDLGPLPAADTPAGEALRWWVDRVQRRAYVGLKDELPSAQAVTVLRDRELIAETPTGWGFATRSPHVSADTALRRNAWGLIAAAIGRYTPAAIDRISAVRLATGEESVPPCVFVRHAANESKWTLGVTDNVSIVLTPDDAMIAPMQATATAPAPTSSIEMSDITIGATPPVVLRTVSASDLLCSIPIGDIKDNLDTIAAWLRTLVVGQPALERAYVRSPRPILLKRMGLMAREMGNARLADAIESVLTAQTTVKISRAQTGVGTSLIIPRYVSGAAPASSPWLERFRLRLAHALSSIESVAGAFEQSLPALDEARILTIARASKADDTYHSTTIEGYRITREEVHAVLAGQPFRGRTPAETERLMALKGYAQAFDWTLARIRQAGVPQPAPKISESLFLDLFIELWSPSIDAGVTDAPALRAWRNQAVLINGSDHVPSAPEKLPGLMAQCATQLNESTVGPITRAITAHWAFVHLHPFRDGNGRVARLSMNYLLGVAGVPWTTIRAEERQTYFSALERAHVHEDFVPFATLVVDAVRRSYAEHATQPT